MAGGNTKRATRRLNVDQFLDFFLTNFQGNVNVFQPQDKERIRRFFDFLGLFLAGLPLLLVLFFAFCLAFEDFFVPGFLGGGVDLVFADDDDFLADLEAVLRADFRVVFLEGMVLS